MVEYVLLFALGVFSAVLIGLFVAPTIHGRIVALTERRLRATLPMTPAEMRAASDMARAAHAAENAKVSMDLKRERDQRVEAIKRADVLESEVAEMRGDIAELVRHIDAMGVTGGTLRSQARQMERNGDTLKLALADAERTIAKRDGEAKRLSKTLNSMAIDLEDMRIDLAARDTEVESLKSSVSALGEDRRVLREDLASAEKALKDAAFRLEREETRSSGLDRKLHDALARLTDQESLLERRSGEIDRLKAKLAAAEADLHATQRQLAHLQPTGSERQAANGVVVMQPAKATAKAANQSETSDMAADSRNSISQRVEKLRVRHSALVDRLVTIEGDREDDALRDEIKDIAADMVSLTALREGEGSPIHKILANAREITPANGGTAKGSQSLAARSSAMLREG